MIKVKTNINSDTVYKQATAENAIVLKGIKASEKN